MKKKFLAFSCALILLLSLCACGGNGEKNLYAAESAGPSGGPWDSGISYDSINNFAGSSAPQAPAVKGDSMDYDMEYDPQPIRSDTGGDTTVYSSEMKIIKTGNLSIESKTFDDTDSYIKQLSGDMGGLLTDQTIYGDKGHRRAEYTVRIPSAKFDSFFYQISGDWTVTNQSISSEDVTEQFSDLELRLETNKAKHDRLLTLLDKAETLTDIYSIQTELAQVEYEIDSITGTLNHLSSKIAYSTIYISVREVVTETVQDDGSFWSEMGASLSNGWNSLMQDIRYWATDFAYYLPSLIMRLVLLTVFIFIIVKVYRFIKKKTGWKGLRKKNLRRSSDNTPPISTKMAQNDTPGKGPEDSEGDGTH